MITYALVGAALELTTAPDVLGSRVKALREAMDLSLRELAQRKRPWMGATAPSHGLTLVRVLYPAEIDPFR